MQYFGGKQRISKYIIPILQSLRKPDQVYLEPFVGSANIVIGMDGYRYASDNHQDLILLLQAVQAGTFQYPDNVTEEDYQKLRNAEPSAMRAFVGFGCSYSGKWFGGFARSGKRKYFVNARNSLIEKSKKMEGINFMFKDYREYLPKNCLIYCDPPYKHTTKIHGVKFDSNEFWDIMRKWSVDNTVVISEYEAPVDFKCIKEIKTKTDISGKEGKYDRVERLYQLE
jgi:DNA adenine methylase